MNRGSTGVIPEGLGPAYINQHLALLRVRDFDPVFLSAYLASPGGQKQIHRLNRQGVKAGLNFDDIRGLQVASPPKALQARYHTVADGVRHRREQLLKAQQATDALFRSLQDRAFGGNTCRADDRP